MNNAAKLQLVCKCKGTCTSACTSLWSSLQEDVLTPHLVSKEGKKPKPNISPNAGDGPLFLRALRGPLRYFSNQCLLLSFTHSAPASPT